MTGNAANPGGVGPGPETGGKLPSKVEGGPVLNFEGNLQRLELKPGDRFVLTVDRALSQEEARMTHEYWKAFLGDDAEAEHLKLMIIGPGMTLGVINIDGPTPEGDRTQS